MASKEGERKGMKGKGEGRDVGKKARMRGEKEREEDVCIRSRDS